ncbi:MAG: 4Fe-4S dicluster domain-containing protein [Spirochaetes bacterium]|nr:MAG: 4Fe-4S dicluster domain-containing protein [Spirochaetota bacterium]
MSDDIYLKLAEVLGSLPNGFPRAQNGADIDLLKKVFEPHEAELFCALKLRKETVDEIAMRTGRDEASLGERLGAMWERGLVDCDPSGPARRYGLVPWILGLYELQNKRLDEGFARLHAKYIKSVGPYFLAPRPHMMQVLPIEKELTPAHDATPYEQVSAIIERSVSFAVNDCICKKQMSFLNRACDKPREVCLSVSDKPDYFRGHPLVKRIITRGEALEILQRAEEAGLVHMTTNTRHGQFFICNCCGCCCVQLMAARFGLPDTVNAHYFARIDESRCKNCGTCSETRCPIKAIDAVENARRVNTARCIGCGLCASACPEKAIVLVRKEAALQAEPPEDEMDWYRAKARAQGLDITRFE